MMIRNVMSLSLPVVYRKIVQTGRLAQKLGAKILGMGASEFITEAKGG